jgi:dTDP-4-amino-4,6-dideoxygalactose transaminase
MDSVQGAVLNIKLKKLDEWNSLREQQAQMYSELLSGAPIKLPTFYEDSRSVWHCYVIVSDRRDQIKSRLLEAGVETGLHYPVPIHLQKAYSSLGHKAGDFVASEELSRNCLSLPIYPELTEQQVRAVVKAMEEAVIN